MRWALWGLIALNALQAGYIVSQNKHLVVPQISGATKPAITSSPSDIQPIAGQILSVRRDVFSDFMESGQALRSVQFSPWPQGGFLAKRIKPESLVARLGLQEGDIVKAVNNTELNSVLHALSVYQDLQTLHFLALRLERANQPKWLLYRLVD